MTEGTTNSGDLMVITQQPSMPPMLSGTSLEISDDPEDGDVNTIKFTLLFIMEFEKVRLRGRACY